MLISQVFNFGFFSKKKAISRRSSSSSSSEDAEKLSSKYIAPTPVSEIRSLESAPVVCKNEKPERRKSRSKLFGGKRTSSPPKLEIVRVGADGSPSKAGDSPKFSKVLWRDQFGAEELAGLLLTPREIERQEIINELVLTELDYVTDLSLVNQLYIKPLLDNNIVSQSNIKDIFLNLPALLTLHQFFFEALRKRANQQKPIVKDISDVILEWIKELSIYTDYLIHQRHALAEYERLMSTNKRFAAFIKLQSSRPESRGFDIISYLMKPFQRLLRYPLLLKNLLEVSSSGTLDYINTIKCHLALEDLINRIQEKKFRQEQAPTLEAWRLKIPGADDIKLEDSRRKLKLEGLLTVVHTENPDFSATSRAPLRRRNSKSATPSLKKESVHFALFGDILIHVPEQHRKGLTKFQLLSSPHHTTTLCKVVDVRNLPDSLIIGQKNWFIIETIDVDNRKLMIEAENEEQKEQWMKALRLAIPLHTGH